MKEEPKQQKPRRRSTDPEYEFETDKPKPGANKGPAIGVVMLRLLRQLTDELLGLSGNRHD